MSYLETFRRHYLLIFKNPGLIILMFVGPLFLTYFFGGVYLNNYVEDIPIAILDEDNSSLSFMLGDYFSNDDRFRVDSYPSSRQELERLIDDGSVHMGLWIPSDFESNLTTFKGSRVLLLTDGSNLVVSNNAYAQAMSIVQTVSAGIEMKLIQGKGLTPQMSEDIALIYNIGDRVLYDSKMTYMNYLIICFLAIFLQQLFLSGMGNMLLKQQVYISKDHLISRVLATASACILGLTPAAALCFYSLKIVFKVPFNGDIGLVALISVIYLFSLTGPALLLASITKSRITFSQFSLMLSLPTFVSSGSVWPVEQMPKLLQMIIRALWPLINYAKIIQEILIKGRTYTSVAENIREIIIYGLIWLLIGLYSYDRVFTKKQDNYLTGICNGQPSR